MDFKAGSKEKDDTEVAKELFNRALKIDNTLFSAKMALGDIYTNIGDFDEARNILNSTLIQVKELNDNINIGKCYTSLADVYWNKGDTDESLKYSFLAKCSHNFRNNSHCWQYHNIHRRMRVEPKEMLK